MEGEKKRHGMLKGKTSSHLTTQTCAVPRKVHRSQVRSNGHKLRADNEPKKRENRTRRVSIIKKNTLSSVPPLRKAPRTPPPQPPTELSNVPG
jgi:hypothetical protein